MTSEAVAPVRARREGGTSDCPPGPRGTEAARTLARMLTGRPLEACATLFARYGDTVYLPVRPWPGLYRLCRHYRLDLASPALPRPRGLVTLRPAGPVPMRLTRRG